MAAMQQLVLVSNQLFDFLLLKGVEHKHMRIRSNVKWPSTWHRLPPISGNFGGQRFIRFHNPIMGYRNGKLFTNVGRT